MSLSTLEHEFEMPVSDYERGEHHALLVIDNEGIEAAVATYWNFGEPMAKSDYDFGFYHCIRYFQPDAFIGDERYGH